MLHIDERFLDASTLNKYPRIKQILNAVHALLYVNLAVFLYPVFPTISFIKRLFFCSNSERIHNAENSLDLSSNVVCLARYRTADAFYISQYADNNSEDKNISGCTFH